METDKTIKKLFNTKPWITLVKIQLKERQKASWLSVSTSYYLHIIPLLLIIIIMKAHFCWDSGYWFNNYVDTFEDVVFDCVFLQLFFMTCSCIQYSHTGSLTLGCCQANCLYVCDFNIREMKCFLNVFILILLTDSLPSWEQIAYVM